jgi:dihydrodipicolinate synthase/N-acetylneuraminate lyase
MGHLRNLIRRVVGAGITVVTASGNTGEFYALTPEETRGVGGLPPGHR